MIVKTTKRQRAASPRSRSDRWGVRMTTEFSFVLRPSRHGIGVFAVNFIEKGSFLRLFGDAGDQSRGARIRLKDEVPEPFRQYCLDLGDRLAGPRDFGTIPLGWYLNHSPTPNGMHD